MLLLLQYIQPQETTLKKKSFVTTASKWGITVSTEKTKGLAAGWHEAGQEAIPIELASGSTEMVDKFTYPGSTISRNGELKDEIACRVGKAARAFGSLKKPIFQNHRLCIATKRSVYRAVVLLVLLYGAETWIVKVEHLRRLNFFHNRCIRSILGVSRIQQWKERISSKQLAIKFGMEESISDMLKTQRLRWLGHLARMNPNRMPKQLLFGELEKRRTCHGTKRRWRDIAKSDLQLVKIENWYEVAQDRKLWFHLCTDGLQSIVGQSYEGSCAANHGPQNNSTFPCACGKSFRWKGNLTCHSLFCDSASTPS